MREVGRRLQQARIEQGMSIDEMQERTKIRAQYLEAIENGEWSVLPGKFYAKMFIKTYAESLGLPANELLSQIKEEIDHNSGLSSASTAVPADQMPAWLLSLQKKAPLILGWILAVLLIVLIYSWLSGGESETDPASAVSTQRVTTIGQESADQAWQVATIAPIVSEQPAITPALESELLSASPQVTSETQTMEPTTNLGLSTDGQDYRYVQPGLIASSVGASSGSISAQDISDGVELYSITGTSQISAKIKIFGEASWTEIRTGSRKGTKIKLGKEVFTQGDVIDVTLAKSVWIRLGDPSAAELVVNGQGVSLGADKKPRTIAFLIDGIPVDEPEATPAVDQNSLE